MNDLNESLSLEV